MTLKLVVEVKYKVRFFSESAVVLQEEVLDVFRVQRADIRQRITYMINTVRNKIVSGIPRRKRCGNVPRIARSLLSNSLMSGVPRVTNRLGCAGLLGDLENE